jgi:hypothetical protein
MGITASISITPLGGKMADNWKMTAKEYIELCEQNKMFTQGNKGALKYGNRKCEYKGLQFDSEGERDRWILLRHMEDHDEITDLKRQVKICVSDSDVKRNKIHWIPDFEYYKSGQRIIEDFKSAPTLKEPLFRNKVKMFKKLYPEVKVLISTREGVMEWKS